MAANIFYKKENVDLDTIENSTAVIIDVCFFSSTSLAFFGNGIYNIIPIRSAEDLEQYENKENVVCAGESDRYVRNSPQAVMGKMNNVDDKVDTVAFFSDNGCQALLNVKDHAENTVVASSTNISAVYDTVKKEDNVSIVCAGRKGSETVEDNIVGNKLLKKISDGKNIDFNNISVELEQGMGEIKEPYPWASSEAFEHILDVDRYDFVPYYDKEKGSIVRSSLP